MKKGILLSLGVVPIMADKIIFGDYKMKLVEGMSSTSFCEDNKLAANEDG